ncbi:MAG: FHA domain-containing protein [Planctomycetales bacterium]|nr:FHA domain-containing protein [Planctomycetales bacterium]
MAARLVPLGVGSPIIIDKAIVLIGRHPDCDAVLQTSVKVSRRHCCLAQVDDHYMIRDLGSMNGIRLNGNRVRESDLHAGDEVSIGDVRYVFKCEELSGTNGKAAANGRQNGKAAESKPVEATLEEPAEPSSGLPPAPLDLSMEFPVLIPDEHPEAEGVSEVRIEDSGPQMIPDRSEVIPLKDID